MDAFIKSFATFRTVQRLSVLSKAMVIDSLEAEISTMTVAGTSVTRKNTGDWLIWDGRLYLISAVKPQDGRTVLTLAAPIEAFRRPLELQAAAETVGKFVENVLTSNWTEGTDPAYAIPYLVVSDSDATPFVAPEVDKNGCFSLPDYCRLMRKNYHVEVIFDGLDDTLNCQIKVVAPVSRQVSFEDGRSQLKSVAFSAGGLAKITVLCDTDTGEKDENGDKIFERSRSDWYLSESGEVTDSVPERRASGDWDVIVITEKDDPKTKAMEAFAKNRGNHKLEFFSTRDLAVGDICTFCVYGELLTSHISYKRRSSGDDRFYYKSGELATTGTEKLRGVTK